MSQLCFDEHDMQTAAQSWGANCGPSALAFTLGIHIEEVRGKIPGFDEKRYTSPTMMKAALANLGFTFADLRGPNGKPAKQTMFSANGASLTRIQWTGPWTAPGTNPKWAYWHTHWICTYILGNRQCVFDCNGGIRSFESWELEIVPILLESNQRADGGWFPTHVWRPVKK